MAESQHSDNATEEPVVELRCDAAPAVPELPLQQAAAPAVAEQRCSAAAPEAEPAPPEVPGEGWQVAKPKRRGRPPGSKNKPKIAALPPEPDLIEEEHQPSGQRQPDSEPATTVASRAAAARRPRAPADELQYTQRQPLYEPPRLSHQDLGSILSEHLLQVERQKRLSQQEMYARLVRGVL